MMNRVERPFLEDIEELRRRAREDKERTSLVDLIEEDLLAELGSTSPPR